MLKLPSRRRDKVSSDKRREKQMIADRKAKVIQMMGEGNITPTNRDQVVKNIIVSKNFKLP
jgi:hypothetical protein